MLTGILFALASLSRVNADSLASRLDYQLWSYPQEKVHVVTDRGAYLSGDTVRFRAFVVDAATHAPVNRSKYLYVELADPFGYNVERVKIMEKDGVYAGELPLNREMAEGAYTLSAYTLFMQNQGADYFYRKVMPVKSIYSLKYSMTPEFDFSGNDLRLRVKLTEAAGRKRPVECESLVLTFPDENTIDAGRKKSHYSFKISDDRRKMGVVKVTFDNFSKFIFLPADTSLVDVTFHPEGGYLVPGEMNTLAFKALDGAGRGVEIEGALCDSTGAQIATLKSRHLGMGTVQFIPEVGQKYSAMICGKKYPLPSPAPDAAVVRVATNKTDRLTVSAFGNVPEGAMILAHSRGRMLFTAPATSTGITISNSQLDAGIVQFLLVDPQGHTLSSRMAFVYPDENTCPVITADSILNVHGSFCVSITANAHAEADTLNSITAQMLLQSDLRGHIEDPYYYFRKPNRQTHADLDALMLTQGWERYDIPATLTASFTTPLYPIEIGAEMTGVIKSRWKGKPIKDAAIHVMVPEKGFATTATTDSDGKFKISGYEWENGTTFTFMAYGPNGNKEHNYYINPEQYPEIFPLFPPLNSNHNYATNDGFTINPSDYTVMLKEISVTATRYDDDPHTALFKALGARTYDSEFFESRSITTYEEAIRLIPGLYVSNGAVKSMAGRNSIFGQSAEVEFWIDGSRWNSSTATNSVAMPILRQHNVIGGMNLTPAIGGGTSSSTLREFSGAYPFSIIEKIEYLRPSSAIILSSSAMAGALVFTTKSGAKISNWDKDLFIKTQTPLGFQRAPEAYRPHYTYREDYNSPEPEITALWIPELSSISEIPKIPNSTIVISGMIAGQPVFMVHK